MATLGRFLPPLPPEDSELRSRRARTQGRGRGCFSAGETQRRRGPEPTGRRRAGAHPQRTPPPAPAKA